MKKFFVLICVTALVCASCGAGLSVDDAIKQVKETTEKIVNNPEVYKETVSSFDFIKAIAVLHQALEGNIKVDDAKKAEITEVMNKWGSVSEGILNPKTEDQEGAPADSLKTE